MDSFVGSIFSFGFNFAPVGWAQCNGQLMSISEYQALYSLIGTTYGGDGQTTFAVPNMQGRVAIGTGQGPGLPNYLIGQAAGNENITLTLANLPSHTHSVLTANIPVSNTNQEQLDPTGRFFGKAAGTAGNIYNSASNGVSVGAHAGSTGITGNGVPFSILNPYLVINYCISLFGIFPSRN